MTRNWAGIAYHRISSAIRSIIGERTRLHNQLWEGLIIVVRQAEMVGASRRLYNFRGSFSYNRITYT